MYFFAAVPDTMVARSMVADTIVAVSQDKKKNRLLIPKKYSCGIVFEEKCHSLIIVGQQQI